MKLIESLVVHNGAVGRANRLIGEKSPYLLEHLYNPVNWYPWAPEAFEKAKRENKPVFLSIGYSSCHWCHQMRKESFEDAETAKLLNENFVSIKVDREERPDVDEVYMKAVMSMTGSGGWPLSVFLTPSGEPFYGGTYFPPEPRYGMPSFSNVLRNVSQAWKSNRKTLVESAGQVKNALNQMYSFEKSEGSKLDGQVIGDCYSVLVGSFDQEYGGFGSSPKFPTPSNLFFLTRYFKQNRSQLALSMVTRTLNSMSAGGIYDHVGGGFHRYSTDRYWLIPHFEKMLYDNALLIQAFIEGYLLTRNENYSSIVRETIRWVLGEMENKSGGFLSAQDADSPEGEGAFYAWSKDDLRDALFQSPELLEKIDLVAEYFSITTEGNFEGGKTILTGKSIDSLAAQYKMKPEELKSLIDRAKRLMFDFRSKRPKPFTDDKILTSWNGLMISALSRAYEALGEVVYLHAALRGAEFVLNNLVKKPESDAKPILLRSFRDGAVGGQAVLEDYSFLINGLMDLYDASFDPKYVESAVLLCDSMVFQFYDDSRGGFFQTPRNSKALIARPKDAFDGALPSGNSIAALVCLRLSELTGRADLSKKTEDTLLAFSSAVAQQPASFTELLVAQQMYLGKKIEIVISGKTDSQETEDFLREIRSQFLPGSIVILADKRIEKISPLVEGKTDSAKPVVYVCSNFSCKMPSTTVEELRQTLNE